MNSEPLYTPQTLIEAVRYFADPAVCHGYMLKVKWPRGRVVCPKCGGENIGVIASRRMLQCKAKECRKQFSAKVGTIFEDSPLPLSSWFVAVWSIANAKNGVSSCELARALGVTQKSAWFMLHRIRLAMQDGSLVSIGGQVEADETFIGGKARFMHKSKKGNKRGGPWSKTPVMGLLERTTAKRASRVIAKVLEGIKKPELQANVRQYVLKGAEVHTDQLLSYEGLADEYTHNVINHAECYVKGHVHTNGMENFWSLLKRTIKGTYVSVEPFHLFRYLDEQAFRFNEGGDNDYGRFRNLLSSVFGKRLTYEQLIGNAPEASA